MEWTDCTQKDYLVCSLLRIKFDAAWSASHRNRKEVRLSSGKHDDIPTSMAVFDIYDQHK